MIRSENRTESHDPSVSNRSVPIKPAPFTIRYFRFSASPAFTITELLVAINLAFILVSLSLGVYVSTSRTVARWIDHSQVSRDIGEIAHRIALDLARASHATLRGDTLLTLESVASQIDYLRSDTSIARNGAPFKPADGEVLNSQFGPPTESNQPRARVQVFLTLRQRSFGRTLTVCALVPSNAQTVFESDIRP